MTIGTQKSKSILFSFSRQCFTIVAFLPLLMAFCFLVCVTPVLSCCYVFIKVIHGTVILGTNLFNSSHPYKIHAVRGEVLEELKLNAAEIIRTLRKPSAGLRIEDVFSIEESATDPEIQLFRKILISLKSVCPHSDVDNFSSKFLDVMTQCKQRRVFRTALLIFWIKLEGLFNHSQFTLRNITRVQSQRPETAEALLESEEDEFHFQQEHISAQIVEFLDIKFEKSFNPGNHLFTCERGCCGAGCLWIVTEIHEIYFLYFYRKSAKLRTLHYLIEPYFARCSYCALCLYIICAPIVASFIAGITFCLVTGTRPFQL